LFYEQKRGGGERKKKKNRRGRGILYCIVCIVPKFIRHTSRTWFTSIKYEWDEKIVIERVVKRAENEKGKRGWHKTELIIIKKKIGRKATSKGKKKNNDNANLTY